MLTQMKVRNAHDFGVYLRELRDNAIMAWRIVPSTVAPEMTTRTVGRFLDVYVQRMF